MEFNTWGGGNTHTHVYTSINNEKKKKFVQEDITTTTIDFTKV